MRRLSSPQDYNSTIGGWDEMDSHYVSQIYLEFTREGSFSFLAISLENAKAVASRISLSCPESLPALSGLGKKAHLHEGLHFAARLSSL